MAELERLYIAETNVYENARRECLNLQAERAQNREWVSKSFEELRTLMEKLGPLRRASLSLLVGKTLVRCGYMVIAYVLFSFALYGTISPRDIFVFCAPIAILGWVYGWTLMETL
jgi:hypothetical protein